MKLTVRKKGDGRFFIVVILIIIIITLTVGEIRPITLPYQGFCQIGLEQLPGKTLYINTVGVVEQFLQVNSHYIKRIHSEYIENDGDRDAVQLKIIIININIIVLLIVTSLLVFRGESRPVDEVIDAASKNMDKELAMKDISYQPSEELEICSSNEAESPSQISATIRK